MPYETLEILEKLNTIYNSAFYNLLIFTVALLAFVGALIPFLISVYQTRQFRSEQNTIKSAIAGDLQNQFNQLKQEVANNIIKNVDEQIRKYDSKIAEMKKEYDKKIASVDAGTFHIQGINELEQKAYSVALASFLASAKRYMDSMDELNLQRIMNLIKNDCLPKIDKSDFNLLTKLDKGCQDFVEMLEKANENGKYHDYITDIKKLIHEAKSRISPLQAAKPLNISDNP